MTHEEALSKLIDAWDALPTGDYAPRVVENWLVHTMAPAIQDARDATGRPRPVLDNCEKHQ